MQSGNASITVARSFDGLIPQPLPPETRERLLRCPLGQQDSVLLPLTHIAEVLRIDRSDILAIPEMPGCVVGICNWRGEMLWLVDLHGFAGYPSPLQQEPLLPVFTVIVIQSGSHTLGLAVPQVDEIELHDLQQLQPPPMGLFSPELLPLVTGILPGCSNAVLNLPSLIQCPLWKKHPKGEA